MLCALRRRRILMAQSVTVHGFEQLRFYNCGDVRLAVTEDGYALAIRDDLAGIIGNQAFKNRIRGELRQILISVQWRCDMSITVNIYYKGENGSARKFAEEMSSSGTVDAIRNEKGNIRYEYFYPIGDEETVLLIDSWENQEAIDIHHGTPMMDTIFRLRDKYDLHMKVERYFSDDEIPESDKQFIKN